MDRPPCWPEGQPCPNDCARAHWERVVLNHHHLHADWSAWRFAGRYLIAPDGTRITPRRLLGLLWSDECRSRVAAAEARKRARRGLASVVRLPPRERFEGSA